MPSSILRSLATAGLFATAMLASAQTAPRAKPDPLDARADVPPITYRSPLAHLPRHAEQPLISWKEANETTERIGGWRVYAREAGTPAAPPAGASAPAAKPAEPPKAASQSPAGHPAHKH